MIILLEIKITILQKKNKITCSLFILSKFDNFRFEIRLGISKTHRIKISIPNN